MSGRRRLVVLMDDYADQARHLPCVRELARQAELQIYTTKAASNTEMTEIGAARAGSNGLRTRHLGFGSVSRKQRLGRSSRYG
jgi:hypothetical protein